MQTKYENIALALAGILQSVALVREFAKTGKLDEAHFTTCIYSVFQSDPTAPDSIYGGLNKLKFGLEKLLEVLGSTQTDRSAMRYMLSLIHIQKKVSRSYEITQIIHQRLQRIKKQADYFSLTHSTVIGNLADIYANAISTFRFRIMIWGNQRVLGAQDNMNKIRALLFAGIRSASLWRQMGGSRLQLFFSRSKIKKAAEKLLADIQNQEIRQQ